MPRMRHTVHTTDYQFYFYDGELPVKGGVIEIPNDRPEWVSRAKLNGFVEEESAESEKGTDEEESPDSGRQPVSDDRVRGSEPESSESVSE